MQQDEGHGTVMQLYYRWYRTAQERMREGKGAGELTGLVLHAVPERWAFLADSSFEKGGRRQQEPQGMLCHQERQRVAVAGVRADCS